MCNMIVAISDTLMYFGRYKVSDCSIIYLLILFDIVFRLICHWRLAFCLSWSRGSGCCCDTRRAVLVVNIVSLSMYTLIFLLLGFDYPLDERWSSGDKKEMILDIAELVTGISCTAVGIYGASNFNRIAILVAGIWYTFESVGAIISISLVGVILGALYLYPHCVFYWEMNKGVMSRETYRNEKYCCDGCD